MIVKTLEDIAGTKGDAHGDKWHSMRLLHKEDGMGVTLTDSILEAGFEMVLWQKKRSKLLRQERQRFYLLNGKKPILNG